MERFPKFILFFISGMVLGILTIFGPMVYFGSTLFSIPGLALCFAYWIYGLNLFMFKEDN